ncbi:hypothetical protein O3P69_018160 [Scylla paramamosain]|uniref:Uncharacterized protein n=1 Tax=Scylla paramamosain TaxID=85552 RepID=A0AAW0TIU4_SCYPA
MNSWTWTTMLGNRVWSGGEGMRPASGGMLVEVLSVQKSFKNLASLIQFKGRIGAKENECWAGEKQKRAVNSAGHLA